MRNPGWKRGVFFFCLFVQLLSCVRLCHPMGCSKPGFPVIHCLPEFVQTHVHWVDDTIQPSLPLSSPPSPPALNVSQHQGLFQWIGSLHQVAKVIGASASALSTNVWPSDIGGKLAKWTTLFLTRVFTPSGFYFKSDVLCLALFFSEDFPLCAGMTSQICFKILSKSYSKCWL